VSREGETRQEIVRELSSSGFHAICVDNEVAHPGTPDVEWCHPAAQGWMECKRIATWPRNGHVINVPKFPQQQRLWLLRRHAHGGLVHVVLHVGRDRCLLPGAWAARHLGSYDVEPGPGGWADQATVRSRSLIIWTGPEECRNLLPAALLGR
jgi:hypothetical protein